MGRVNGRARLGRILNDIYFDSKNVGSYGGVDRLRRAARVPANDAKKWLLGEDAYTLHKPVRRRFKRRRVIVGGMNQQWQADLVDVARLKTYNDGTTFLLTVIDVFSKKAWCIPLKNKSGASLVRAFRQLLTGADRPIVLQTDKGKEFLNHGFKRFLKKENIHQFTTHNDKTKASIVERFNRTLKTRMWRHFTKRQSLRYRDVLQDLVHSYNNSYHRSIGTAPLKVNEANQEDVWQPLYGNAGDGDTKINVKVGDRVRISKVKKRFDKGYLPNWSVEVFAIKSVHNSEPPVYRLVDDQKNAIESTFYEPELQKVFISDDTVYRIEEILQRRKRAGKEQVLVKWWGYPESFNSWIDRRALMKYKG